MNKALLIIFLTLCAVLTGCVTLQPATVIKNDDMNNYQYLIINGTTSLTSGTGQTINGIYYSESKSVNPRDVISGYMAKKGFIILSETERMPLYLDKTLIVNYGESGRRDVFWGYTTEVTIQFISPETKQLVFSSTAEGIGSTEADDIKKAITRALDALFE
ncbi:MAG: DUF4136 domain-containing protein [Treponema sp.]|nr:DUF4136 domain-containing protein [Treponema sp.]